MTSSPSFQTHLQFEHRESKQAQIQQFFLAHLYERFRSDRLHIEYGSSFRARVADINSDDESPIVIKNENFYDSSQGREVSFYWAESRRHVDLG